MTPRKSKQGAAANARRAPSDSKARAAASSRPPKSAPRASARAIASGSSAGKASQHTARPARPKAGAARPEPSSWRWWLLPLAVLAATAIFVGAYYPVAKVQYRETREKIRLQSELDAIRARNHRLQTTVDRLKTPEGVEDYAREQLGMVKAGEHVGVVVDSNVSTRTAAAAVLATPRIDSEESVVPTVGPWTAFLDSVFGVQ